MKAGVEWNRNDEESKQGYKYTGKQTRLWKKYTKALTISRRGLLLLPNHAVRNTHYAITISSCFLNWLIYNS
jgi:hypothetical protein